MLDVEETEGTQNENFIQPEFERLSKIQNHIKL